MSIAPIVSKITSLSTSQPSATTAAQGIENTFSNILKSLDSTQKTSDNLLQQLSSGQDVDLSQLMIATQQTDTNFRVATALRDKLVDAYNNVMRITV